VSGLTDEQGTHRGKDVDEWTWEFRGDKVTNSQTKGEKERTLGYTLDPSKAPEGHRPKRRRVGDRGDLQVDLASEPGADGDTSRIAAPQR
jgi:hypothetical protein